MREAITGVILAGGEARRLGGQDKGLVQAAGRALIEHVIEHLAPQCTALLISANRNLELYAAYGYPVIADLDRAHQGPLAGILSALEQAHTEFILTVPCDAPLLHADTAARFCRSSRQPARVAFDGIRWQPLFGLFSRTLAGGLRDYLDKGGSRAMDWLQQIGAGTVDFSDHAAMFANLNTPDDIAEFEKLVCR